MPLKYLLRHDYSCKPVISTSPFADYVVLSSIASCMGCSKLTALFSLALTGSGSEPNG